MSVDNIVSLADARAARPKAPYVAPTEPPVPGSWSEVFEQTEAQGQYALALMFEGGTTAAEMADALTGGLEAGWKATTLQAHPSGGLVVGMAVAARVIDGGAS